MTAWHKPPDTQLLASKIILGAAHLIEAQASLTDANSSVDIHGVIFIEEGSGVDARSRALQIADARLQFARYSGVVGELPCQNPKTCCLTYKKITTSSKQLNAHGDHPASVHMEQATKTSSLPLHRICVIQKPTSWQACPTTSAKHRHSLLGKGRYLTRDVVRIFSRWQHTNTSKNISFSLKYI